MSLMVICGERHVVNAQLLQEAVLRAPSLIIDPATCADPHALLRIADPAVLDDIHVIEIDLIYKLRDTLLALPATLELQDISVVLISTFDRLFTYQDAQENIDVYEQIWLLLRRLGANYTLIVGVKKGTLQETLAKKYAEVLNGTHSDQSAASA